MNPTFATLLCLGACSPAPEVVSPAEGAVVTGPWVPLLVTVPSVESTVQTWIDGVESTDPLGVTRERFEGGVDHIATLDLLELDPGEHELQVVIATPGALDRHAEVTFTIDRPPFRLDVHTIDEDGEPLAARVRLRQSDAPFVVSAPGAETDPGGRDTALSTLFAPNGETSVWLDPGTYTLVATRGVRDALGIAEVDLIGDAEVRLSVPRQVPTPDVTAADLHVHTARSGDAFVPDRMRFASLVAAGLDAFVVTDHNVATDPSVPLATVAEGAPVTGIPGVEARIAGTGARAEDWSLGHLNVFPSEPGVALPEIAVAEPLDLAKGIDALRAHQRASPYRGEVSEVLVQLNHPEGIQFFPDSRFIGAHALFAWFPLDRLTPSGVGDNDWTDDTPGGSSTTPLSFDTMEILNRFSWPGYLAVRNDWFWMLDQGLRVVGTGNSDSHSLEVELAGLPCNLIATDAPDAGAFADAIRSGDVSVTSGPIVTAEVRAADRSASPGQLIAAGEGGWDLEIRVRAADWVPVDQLRVVVSGRQVYGEDIADATREEDGTLDLTRTLPLTTDTDAWVLVEAGWPLGEDPPVGDGYERLGPYAWVAPGYVPVGFTNPVWLDADGDGVWTPEG